MYEGIFELHVRGNIMECLPISVHQKIHICNSDSLFIYIQDIRVVQFTIPNTDIGANHITLKAAKNSYCVMLITINIFK